jgi:hypothetical protein
VFQREISSEAARRQAPAMLPGFLVDGDDTTVIGAMWEARVRDRRTRLHPGERGGCG